ncbi:MAG: hypothetical protein JO199_02455 [Candidatus Eremiobacteraeota bacterium]|nr:hypothetical protein [Candidatus Eremiobacteraeota bacterium]
MRRSARSPAGPTRTDTVLPALAILLDTLAQLVGAILVGFLAIAIARSSRRTVASWLVRLAIAIPLFLASLWIVFRAIPNAAVIGAEALSIVATFVLLAALAADELIGADLRRLLGI